MTRVSVLECGGPPPLWSVRKDLTRASSPHYVSLEIIDETLRLSDSHRVFRKCGYILMILAVLSATGTHWLALQSVAWTAMLAENLHSTSWQQAVERTFDGKHPCCLCRQIAAAKQSEKKSDAQVEVKKIDYFYASFQFVFCPPSHYYEIPALNKIAASLTRAPSDPPPEKLLA